MLKRFGWIMAAVAGAAFVLFLFGGSAVPGKGSLYWTSAGERREICRTWGQVDSHSMAACMKQLEAQGQADLDRARDRQRYGLAH